MMEALRLEQANTEAILAKIDVGVEKPENKAIKELDKNFPIPERF